MRSRLRPLRLKHLNASGTWPSGRPRLYFRPKGQKAVALPDFAMDDPRFLAAYAAAAGVEPRAPVLAGSIAAARERYLRSDDWAALSKGTQNRRRVVIDDLAARYGAGRLGDLRREHLEADLARFAGWAHNNRLKAWRHFCAWLVVERLVPVNPSDGIRRRRTAASDGHQPWTAEDVAAFRAHWPLASPQRLALELLHWTGARMSDAVRLGEGSVRDGWIAYAQQKTGGEVFVPFRRPLPEFAADMRPDRDQLEAALAARTVRHVAWMVTAQGRGRSIKAASQWFAAAARAASIDGKTAHGLRKSRVEALIEAGASTAQAQAWLGHEDPRMVSLYAKKFDRRRALSSTKPDPKVPTKPTKFQKQARKAGKSSD